MDTSEKGTFPPWLVMLYLAGDNNLTEEMVLALQDLAAQGPPREGTKIVAQLDPSAVGIEAQRYRFISTTTGSDNADAPPRVATGKANEGGTTVVTPPAVVPKIKGLEAHRVKGKEAEDLDETEFSTGSPEALTGFAKWALKYDEHRKLQSLLVLSGHGAGTSSDFLMRDDNAQDALSIEELCDALKQVNEKRGGKLDIIGFDACFMSMGEVAYEIRDYADIVIGAE